MPVRFYGFLQLRKLNGEETHDGRSKWVQTGELRAVVVPKGGGPNESITVGEGATTDLGSVPQWAWSLGFPPDGIGDEAYAVHDLLYRTKGACVWKGSLWRTREQPYTRVEADEILREGLIACGLSTWRAYAIWTGVRLGGATGWGQ